MQAFTERVSALRRRHPLFRRRTYFRGRAVRDSEAKDIVWLSPDGREMTDEEWNQGFARCLGAHLSGRGLHERAEYGRPVEDDDLLLLLNAHDDVIPFRIPSWGFDRPWHALIDTDRADGLPAEHTYAADAQYPLKGRSVALLFRHRKR